MTISEIFSNIDFSNFVEVDVIFAAYSQFDYRDDTEIGPEYAVTWDIPHGQAQAVVPGDKVLIIGTKWFLPADVVKAAVQEAYAYRASKPEVFGCFESYGE